MTLETEKKTKPTRTVQHVKVPLQYRQCQVRNSSTFLQLLLLLKKLT